jgi:phasin
MTDGTTTARKFPDQSTAQTKDAFQKTIAAGEEATHRIKNMYAGTSQTALDFHRRVLAIAQANVDAAFNCAQELVGVTSPSEFMEIATSHARQQVEAVTEQTKELTALAQKAANDSMQPLAGLSTALQR